jgi:hypothetical protein
VVRVLHTCPRRYRRRTERLASSVLLAASFPSFTTARADTRRLEGCPKVTGQSFAVAYTTLVPVEHRVPWSHECNPLRPRRRCWSQGLGGVGSANTMVLGVTVQYNRGPTGGVAVGHEVSLTTDGIEGVDAGWPWCVSVRDDYRLLWVFLGGDVPSAGR